MTGVPQCWKKLKDRVVVVLGLGQLAEEHCNRKEVFSKGVFLN